MRRKRVAGPIVPLEAYARLAYQCIRCDTMFDSPTGPEPFCETCRETLARRGTPQTGGDTNG